MLGKLNHVAIAVPDLAAARSQYATAFGADISDPKDLPDHGVSVVMITLPNARIELLSPLGENSPIQKFLNRNPAGGVHHLCFEVPNIIEARDQLAANGVQVIGDGTPKAGYDGYPVLFFNPKDCQGTLIELKQSVLPQDIKVSVEDSSFTPDQGFESAGGIALSFEGDFVRPTPTRQE